ncbi:MAG: hypothetical protein ABI977_14485 [Acidobacteriota bacterium]
MWKRIIDSLFKALTFMQRQERQEKALKDQQEEVKRLAAAVTHLAFELQRTQDQLHHQVELVQYHAEREAYERKLLLKEFEIRLLKEKLRLPPQSKKTKDDEDGE